MAFANVELDNLSNTDINADLRIFANATEIWRADQDIGLTRDQFSGKETLSPAALGNPDVVEVTLPRYIGCDFVTFVCGGKGVVTKNSTSYDIYPTWHAPVFVCSPTTSAFHAHVTWEVYSRTTNKLIGGGPWNNLRQLCVDMTAATPYDWDVDDIPTGTKTLHWVWPL